MALKVITVRNQHLEGTARYHFTCTNCGSLIEGKERDFKAVGDGARRRFRCPNCNERNRVSRADFDAGLVLGEGGS